MSGTAALLVVAFMPPLGPFIPGGGPSTKIQGGEAAEVDTVAREFLSAFCKNDRDAIRGMLPTKTSALYGPCLFGKMPVLGNPRVEGRTAAVDFEGPMADSALPGRGMIVLRHVEQDGLRAWRVRQLYWYEELPPEARLPERSRTEDDKAQEPSVVQAAQEFLSAWLAGDHESMSRLTFRWWEVSRRRPGWVRLIGVDVQAHPAGRDERRVEFVARLRLAGLMAKSVRGRLWVVREGDSWRVRPLTFAFFF